MVDLHYRLNARPLSPTVHAFNGFNPEEDCQNIKAAMKGNLEPVIINILCRRSLKQRLQIRNTYVSMFTKPLIQEIKSKLSGDLENLVVALLMDTEEYHANCLYTAMKGIGTNEKTLTEIICTRSNTEMAELKSVFFRDYKKDLEKEVSSETSGQYKKILVACLQGNRVEFTYEQLLRIQREGIEALVDWPTAFRDASEMAKSGVKKWAADDNAVKRLLLGSNPAQIRGTIEQYKMNTGKDIFNVLHSDVGGDYGDALLTLILSQISQPVYYARQLFYAMKGLGTRDRTLIRIIVTRSEIDLDQIKREYYKGCHGSLENSVADDTSNEFKNILLALLGKH